MKKQAIWTAGALVIAAPAFYYALQLARTGQAVGAASANPTPMVPFTIVLSEIVSSAGVPRQHAVRVIAYRRDYSMSETYYWTHDNPHSLRVNDLPFDRRLDLFQPGGYFVVEAYSRSKSKVTFPYKPEIGRAKLTTWPSAAENCLKTYGGERVSDDKYLGKQTLFIAGAGNIEAVMTSRQGPDMSLTSWFAPSLGCAEVQHVATFPRKDGSLGVNAMYPITVAMGEPEQE
ncbi:MAG: hypothetical protein KIT09_35905, partial [Bryobacteraceae bacterium]|nr:hypothetical protein [Bryobacteraceae bacterium]